MRAARLQTVGHVVVVDVDEPSLADDEVLIEVQAAGVCGSDVHAFHGRHPGRRPPMLLGHEVAGRVLRTGSAANRFAPGDIVTVLPQIFCGVCRYCVEGHAHLCSSRRTPGGAGWSGTFVERFTAPENVVYPAPPGLTAATAVIAEPLAVVLHACDLLPGSDASRTLVVGGGTIGALAAAVLAERRRSAVVSEPNDAKRRRLAGLGLTAMTPHELDEQPESFDAAIVTVATEPAIAATLRALRSGGCLVLVGVPSGAVPVDLYAVQTRELRLVGSMIYDDDDFQRALELLAESSTVQRMVTSVLPLDDVAAALDLASSPTSDAIKVVLDPTAVRRDQGQEARS